MDKKKRIRIEYGIILILALVIGIIMVYILRRSDLNIEQTYAPDLTLVDNPLMGFAPDSENIRLGDEANLIYITLTWAEWEPREGYFDIEGFESRENIKRWREQNKHAVLRFMCDVPGTEEHMDIPTWLYEKTQSGTFYDTSLGKGYYPDYGDKAFYDYHSRALKKLAEYCNKDHFVSFVQLGSIGHWGEWHGKDGSGRNLMPDAKVCEKYATLYSESFVNAKLMMRRNYEVGVGGGMGFFNDMIGSKEDTDDWLEDITNGGIQETRGKALQLARVNYFGKAAPVGGELTSAYPMSTLMGEGLGEVLAQISACKMTFIGPMVPDLTDKNYAKAIESIQRRMGYRLYVSNLKTQYDYSKKQMNVELTFKNAGNSGIYFDWPVTLCIFDKDKKEVFWEGLTLDLRDLNLDEEVIAYSQVPVSDELKDEFYIGVKITDYDSEQYIRLAIDSEDTKQYIDDAQIIYHYTGE